MGQSIDRLKDVIVHAFPAMHESFVNLAASHSELLAALKESADWLIRDDQSRYEGDTIPESSWGNEFAAHMAKVKTAIANAENLQ